MDGTTLSLNKPLAFVLDALKDDAPEAPKKKRKKDKKEKKESTVTSKNFGQWISMDKMKGTNRFHIGWRVRFL